MKGFGKGFRGGWLIFLVSGWLAGAGLAGAWAGDDGNSDATHKKPKKILYWTDTMLPNYRSDKPGKSPMGMELTPVYEEEGTPETVTGVVRISPTVINNLGVRTAKVRRGPISREIRTVGAIVYDETRYSHVHLRTEGWVERLLVKSVGERVRAGQLLFELYAPTLVNAQEEFLQAQTSNNPGLLRASRNRLRALGISETQIERLVETKRVEQLVSLFAPHHGTVIALGMREGMFVKPDMEVVSLVDLTSIWLVADFFERQASWVQLGQAAEARLPSLPGQLWQGRVEFIYPELDPVSRTLKVRLRFDNPGEILKPNMFAQVVLHADPKTEGLQLPREAVIPAGSGDRVIVALGEGRFQAREIKVGIESGEMVEILDGLKEGEEVVTSAQFLIDSEASLKASLNRMAPPDSPVTPTPAAPPVAPPMAADEVTGILHGIKEETGQISIAHDPIPALGWPAMTMEFRLGEGVTLPKLNPGDAVIFGIREVALYDYRITAIRPAISSQKPEDHVHGAEGHNL